MGCSLPAILAILLLHCCIAAAAPLSDLVTNLPGQPRVRFRQYAGYVTVDPSAGRALFYYFVEVEGGAPQSKPLTLWLNGEFLSGTKKKKGPGCSSIGCGAFTELGPFYPNASGTGLLRNPQSWNKVSNLLFLDSPAGVGWSYSNTSSDYDNVTDEKTAQDTLLFLLGWFRKFPEFRSSDLYITGESYAGHYVPQLASVILGHNERNRQEELRLKGIAIGNPLLNLGIDTAAMYEYFWSHGLISDDTFAAVKGACNFEDYELGAEKQHNVSNQCDVIMGKSDDEVGDFINNYDVILDVCLPSLFLQELRLKQHITQKSYGVDVCIDDERDLYLNDYRVQQALHANVTGLNYKWTMCDGPVQYYLQDGSIDIVPLLQNIVKTGLRVWVFSGDQDSVVPLTGTRTIINGLGKSLNLPATVPYTAWYLGGQVAGWTQVYGNLTYATIRGAAHMVPYAQPARALLLFQTFLSGQTLPKNS
ncbi:serine carboxypeptidase-like enzyme [Selaginella moellendorffii]|uniref:Carboxypeptidase n=1 Tax=Selaginella moellendorffii TaxID=88036 RepID=D8RJL0_SELML|nr:serine carboxypeptidase-like enzyme [Selaginella moellendorffii]